MSGIRCQKNADSAPLLAPVTVPQICSPSWNSRITFGRWASGTSPTGWRGRRRRSSPAGSSQLGYSTLWLPDTVGRDPFAHIAYLARGTETLVFATGIATIFHRHPGAMKQAANTLAEQTGGRFVLGLGVSHAPDGRRAAPARLLEAAHARCATYLDGDGRLAVRRVRPAEQPPTRARRARAEDARARARRTPTARIPYWTTPEHTAQAREILGPDKLLCVEQKVVLVDRRAVAATLAAPGASASTPACPTTATTGCGSASPTTRSTRRDPRFVDAVVAWGDADAIGVRVQAHYDAGATHVCIQPLSPDGFGHVDWSCLEALAPAG